MDRVWIGCPDRLARFRYRYLEEFFSSHGVVVKCTQRKERSESPSGDGGVWERAIASHEVDGKALNHRWHRLLAAIHQKRQQSVRLQLEVQTTRRDGTRSGTWTKTPPGKRAW
jgi:hypothetical protein